LSEEYLKHLADPNQNIIIAFIQRQNCEAVVVPVDHELATRPFDEKVNDGQRGYRRRILSNKIQRLIKLLGSFKFKKNRLVRTNLNKNKFR
jgi:hypothetical protein